MLTPTLTLTGSQISGHRLALSSLAHYDPHLSPSCCYTGTTILMCALFLRLPHTYYYLTSTLRLTHTATYNSLTPAATNTLSPSFSHPSVLTHTHTYTHTHTDTHNPWPLVTRFPVLAFIHSLVLTHMLNWNREAPAGRHSCATTHHSHT